MVDEHGYVVVVDLRQSKRLEEELSYSMAGMPQYLAPEQVRGEGHSFAVDWWALGVLLYEISCGKMLFDAPLEEEDTVNDSSLCGHYAVDELQLARVILEHQEDSLTFPPGCAVSPVVQELIVELLNPDPSRRAGSEGGAAEVREVASLLGVDWQQLGDGSLPSPLATRAANLISAGRGGAASGADSEAAEPEFEVASPSAAEWAKEF